MKKTTLFSSTVTAICLTLGLQPAKAEDATRYIGLNLIAGAPINAFDGYNTAGMFSNKDTVHSDYQGISLTYGIQDKWHWKGVAITPELELAWFNDYDAVSASFPGLPNPMFQYRTNIQTGRIGANLWSLVEQGQNWRAEFGIGGGLAYQEIQTDDTVVKGSKSGVSGYGMVGLRYLRDVGNRGQLSASAVVVKTGKSSISLANIGGVDAGNLSVSTLTPEFRIGYHLILGQ
jgi:hypothetical protein